MFAATDTTSSALARILHLLALHPDVQAKLRAELVEALSLEGGDLPYDTLVGLPYLDAVCRSVRRALTQYPTTHPPSAQRDAAPVSLRPRAPRTADHHAATRP